ncbi:MAG: pilus assembly PilX N-terminal domain-containing protein [Deltaproteobacteria bacterium]|nr:pilus assembly PilX N-terminal domain-containing protein [Deltaproteobacteria bacterium]MBW2398130.1 pilus assembly PilX N-terminal domain-containing protein [Deltaproteobacteria bacterium]MBW2666613.1 pilus assembly PilX N-terminal domain-containing protein [Deltaproteobacteria bacterium]
MEHLDRKKREAGSALLVAMIFAVLMGMIGFASLDTVMRDRQSAGFQNLSRSAIYAADAGIADSLNILRSEIVGNALAPNDCLDATLSDTSLGDGVSYRADPNAPTNEICMIASAEPCAEFDSSIEQGQAVYLYTVWNMRVQGSAPGGATAHLQASAERCHAFNN